MKTRKHEIMSDTYMHFPAHKHAQLRCCRFIPTSSLRRTQTSSFPKYGKEEWIFINTQICMKDVDEEKAKKNNFAHFAQ